MFWPREFHGQRSLAGYSLWGRKESDMTGWPTLSGIYVVWFPKDTVYSQVSERYSTNVHSGYLWLGVLQVIFTFCFFSPILKVIMLHITEAIRFPHISNLQLPLESPEWSQNFSWVFSLPGPQLVLLTSHMAFAFSSKITSPPTFKADLEGLNQRLSMSHLPLAGSVFSKTGFCLVCPSWEAHLSW